MVKRLLLGTVLVGLLGVVGCGPIQPPQPPTPPAVKAVGVEVITEQQNPVVGAFVTLDDVGKKHTGVTDGKGYMVFQGVAASLTQSHLWITATDYTDYQAHLDLPAVNVHLKVTLKAAEPPPDPLKVYGNFCNLKDSTGRVVFSSSLAAQTPEMRKEWIGLERANGGTHYFLSIQTGYTSYPPVINFYTSNRMTEWLKVLDEVLAANLVPVVFLHSGDSYPGQGYFHGVMLSIPTKYYNKCIWVVGWETVAGGYTSRQFKESNEIVYSYIHPYKGLLAAHLSPGRLSFSSNPVEPDDPWGGDEIRCWREWGWDRFDILLYQSTPFRPGDTWNPTIPESPAERAVEVATRVLGTHVDGAPDWFDGLGKRPVLVAFETVAYWQIRGQGDSEYARTVADWFKSVEYQGFGNGVPHGK